MEKEKAIEIFNKWMDCKDAYQADPSCDGNCFSCEYYASAEEEKEAMLLAISALEKQEQTNTQNINSTHTSRPNALESLDILEQAKDDKGNVPMSLVRLAFRNVMEQDRWIPVTERMPEIKHHIDDEHFSDKVLVTEWFNGFKKTRIGNFDTRTGWWNDEKGCGFLGVITSWRPLPEPYTEEES